MELPKRPDLVPTGKSASWKLPALVVAVAVVAFVALIRFTQSGPPAPTPSPVAAVPTATPRPSPSPSPAPDAIPLLPDGQTYVDGIPARVHGVAVLRVQDAVDLPTGRTVLVGGWYAAASAVLANLQPGPVPSALLAAADDSIALDQPLSGDGARVVLATTEADPGCAIVNNSGCQERLHVVDTVWSAATSAQQAPSEDQWRLDVITAVGKDPGNFGGVYIDDANVLIVLYVNDVAEGNLKITVHPELTVDWQKVANSWTFLTNVADDIRSQNIAGVTDVEIDTIDNKVGVYGEGVDLRDVMALGTDYPGAVAFFGHMGASLPTPSTTP